MRSGSLERYAREGRESGTRAAFKTQYYGEDESEAARAARHAAPRYKTRSPSAQRSKPTPRTLADLVQAHAGRPPLAPRRSPSAPTPAYLPAAEVHVEALEEERQARQPTPWQPRSMTPDDPAIAAQIAAEDRARLQQYRSGSIQMSEVERERQRRMPRSSVPPATDLPAPKIFQKTQPRDIRAMRSSVSLQPQPAPVAEPVQRQRQPPRKLSQMRSSVSAVPEAPAPEPAQPTRRGVSEGTLARRYGMKPAMDVDEPEKKRKRALTPVPAPILDKSLGNHQRR